VVIALIIPIYAEDSKKDLCKDNGGDWKIGECDFKTDDEDKAEEFLDDVQKNRGD
jgi:hypothetical protein